MNIQFTVHGEPMGKQRPKATSIGGHARVYTPKNTVQYESKVISAYKEACGEEVTFPDPEEEVYACITAEFQLQKTHYGKRGINQKGLDKLSGKTNPTKAPDCDNIAKIVLDALNGLAYHDDSQITALLVIKRYAEQPCVRVILESKPKGVNDGSKTKR